MAGNQGHNARPNKQGFQPITIGKTNVPTPAPAVPAARTSETDAQPAGKTLGFAHEWSATPACSDHDPNMWFQTGAKAAQAIEICGTCKVRTECLSMGLTQMDPEFKAIPEGIWGGKTLKERKEIRAGLDAAKADQGE